MSGLKLSELCEAQARAYFTREEAARAISDVTQHMKADPAVTDSGIGEEFDFRGVQRHG